MMRRKKQSLPRLPMTLFLSVKPVLLYIHDTFDNDDDDGQDINTKHEANVASPMTTGTRGIFGTAMSCFFCQDADGDSL